MGIIESVFNIISGFGTFLSGVFRQLINRSACLYIESYPARKEGGQIKRPYFSVKNTGEHNATELTFSSPSKIQFPPFHDNSPYKLQLLPKGEQHDFTYNLCEPEHPDCICLHITYKDGHIRLQKKDYEVNI